MKKEAAIGLGLAAVGTILLVTRAKAEPEPPEEVGASIKIEIYDSKGNLVTNSSPLAVDEGESYTIKLTVKNNSTKAGTPWAAVLGIGISAATELTTIIPLQVSDESFSAGQTRSFNYIMDVPMGLGNQVGGISAWVEDPTGYGIASATETLNINTVPIDYGATIVIG